MKHIFFRRAFGVTCYFRHLKDVFARAGIEITSENKGELDKVIHGIVGVNYKNCPAAWRGVKKRLANDEDAFVLELKEEWAKRDGKDAIK